MCDDGQNASNRVYPESVLRSILHDSFPILYLPEFISRRCSKEMLDGKNGGHASELSFDLPSNIKAEYREFLASQYRHKNLSSDDKENHVDCSNTPKNENI